MAGDWIKIRHALPRSGTVVRIMSACDADKLRTLGGLVSALLLFDEQTDCGHLSGYSLKAFDELIGLPGLGAALCDPKVGWMEENEDGLTLLDWDKHNGSSAKRRANDATRKANKRAEKDVRILSEKKRTVCGPEKRREEKNIISLSPACEDEEILPYEKAGPDDPGSVVYPPCTKQDVDLFAGVTGIPDDVAQQWFERHEANDWRPYGKNPPFTTKSWKFDLKNYWKNLKAKQDEQRNRTNGAAKAGKAISNPRNRHLPEGEEERLRQVAEMEDIRDDLKVCTEYPEIVSKINRERIFERPEYEHAIKWIKSRNATKGAWNGVYDRLAESKIIDEQSGRWIADDC